MKTKIVNLGTKEYQLAKSQHTFDILIKELYKNTLAAPIRELIQNAYDAIVDANREHGKVIIQAPSIDNPIFSVSDNGIGLTDEEYANTFAQFFKSTKDKVIDLLHSKTAGFYGLGSKTPWIFTDKFYIETRKQGKKWLFEQYRNNTEFGFKLLRESDAREYESGVTIHFEIDKLKLFKEFSDVTGKSKLLAQTFRNLDVLYDQIPYNILAFWSFYYAISGLLSPDLNVSVTLYYNGKEYNVKTWLEQNGFYIYKSSDSDLIILENQGKWKSLADLIISEILGIAVKTNLPNLWQIQVNTLTYPTVKKINHEEINTSEYLISGSQNGRYIFIPFVRKSDITVTPDRESALLPEDILQRYNFEENKRLLSQYLLTDRQKSIAVLLRTGISINDARIIIDELLSDVCIVTNVIPQSEQKLRKEGIQLVLDKQNKFLYTLEQIFSETYKRVAGIPVWHSPKTILPEYFLEDLYEGKYKSISKHGDVDLLAVLANELQKRGAKQLYLGKFEKLNLTRNTIIVVGITALSPQQNIFDARATLADHIAYALSFKYPVVIIQNIQGITQKLRKAKVNILKIEEKYERKSIPVRYYQTLSEQSISIDELVKQVEQMFEYIGSREQKENLKQFELQLINRYKKELAYFGVLLDAFYPYLPITDTLKKIIQTSKSKSPFKHVAYASDLKLKYLIKPIENIDLQTTNLGKWYLILDYITSS